jgi:hypothetical protein
MNGSHIGLTTTRSPGCGGEFGHDLVEVVRDARRHLVTALLAAAQGPALLEHLAAEGVGHGDVDDVPAAAPERAGELDSALDDLVQRVHEPGRQRPALLVAVQLLLVKDE